MQGVMLEVLEQWLVVLLVVVTMAEVLHRWRLVVNVVL